MTSFNKIGASIGRLTTNPYRKLNISWWNLRMLKNQSRRDIHSQKFLNGTIQFNNALEFLYGVDEIFIDNIYSLRLNKERPVILDCGGHIGLSAIYFRKQHPTASITVFEPDAKSFEFLKNNLASQGYSDVILRNEAIWKENTTLRFSSEASMSSKIAADKDAGIVEVKAVRLKDHLTTEVDLLKLDIEGAEYEVLKDIREQLHFVKNMFIEYHGLFSQQDELLEIFKWVADAGFIFYIKEAYNIYPQPFNRKLNDKRSYDVQLNIFCFRS